MRYITALSFLALFATGCGPETSNPGTDDTIVDTGNPDDTNDIDDTSNAKFEATALADVFTEMVSPVLSVPGATCSGDECAINKPGEYVGTLTVTGWTTLPWTFETETDGEIVVLPFTNEGQTGPTINWTCSGSTTGTIHVATSTESQVGIAMDNFPFAPFTGTEFAVVDEWGWTFNGSVDMTAKTVTYHQEDPNDENTARGETLSCS